MRLLDARIGFVGVGAVGTALAQALAERGLAVVAAWSRSGERARWLSERIPGCEAVATPRDVATSANVVFVTTPDDAIAAVVSDMRWRADHVVIHCSGGHSVAVLGPAAEVGALVGGLHPIQSFARRLGSPEDCQGIWYGVEAEEPLRTELLALVDRLNGKAVVLRPEDKPLYHAAAVFASNYFVTLLAVASELWQRFGVDQQGAIDALLPIVRGTLDNVTTLGVPRGLTGPIARGDVSTVATHLAALDANWPEAGELYRALGRFAVPIGQSKGTLRADSARELVRLLAASANLAGSLQVPNPAVDSSNGD